VVLDRRALRQFQCFNLIRPGGDFLRRFPGSIGLEPLDDVHVGFGRGNGVLELRTVDAFESEKLVIQWAVAMVFTKLAGQTGAAFIHRPAHDGKAAEIAESFDRRPEETEDLLEERPE